MACTYRDLKKAPLSSRDPSTSGTSSASPTALDGAATSSFQEPVDEPAPPTDYGLSHYVLDINSSAKTSAAYQAVDDGFAVYSPLPVSCRPALCLSYTAITN